MAIGRSGYVGVVRTHSGRGNLAAAIDPAVLRLAQCPDEIVAEILNDAGLQLPNLTSGERWHGTLPLTRRTQRLSAERIVLLGDAAGYVEPFTGEGIGWAMQSAVAAAPVIAGNFKKWNSRLIDQWDAAQRRRISRGQFVCRFLAGAMRRPRAVRIALGVLAFAPGLAGPFVRQICRPAFAHGIGNAQDSGVHGRIEMKTRILGIGTSVPQFYAEQADAAQQASRLFPMTPEQQRLMQALSVRTASKNGTVSC